MLDVQLSLCHTQLVFQEERFVKDPLGDVCKYLGLHTPAEKLSTKAHSQTLPLLSLVEIATETKPTAVAALLVLMLCQTN